MSKYRTMIVFLALFVVLLVSYFIILQVNRKQQEQGTEETIMVTEISNLVSMEYTDGETTLSFVKEDEEWHVKDDEETKLDSDLIETISDTLCQVEAVRVLVGADEPGSYGLEEPLYTIALENDSGTVTTLYIGNGAEENYYATINEKAVIYTIDSSVVEALEFDISALTIEETEE